MLFCLRLALLFLHGFLGSDPGCFSVLHVRLIRRLQSGYCFSLPARIADFFFCADSWFRLARVSRARLFLLA